MTEFIIKKNSCTKCTSKAVEENKQRNKCNCLNCYLSRHCVKGKWHRHLIPISDCKTCYSSPGTNHWCQMRKHGRKPMYSPNSCPRPVWEANTLTTRQSLLSSNILLLHRDKEGSLRYVRYLLSLKKFTPIQDQNKNGGAPRTDQNTCIWK